MNTATNISDKITGKKIIEGSSKPNQSEEETMRAVTWQGPKQMTVETIPKPEIAHPDDVIIKVTSCTICSGSDLHVYNGEIPGFEPGTQIGHEAMGVVESKGENVKNFQEGDRAVISFCIACGKCEHCQKQQFSGCERTNDSKVAEKIYGHAPAALFGYGKLMSDIPGSQAEYVRVPFADVNLYKVPEDVPDEKALFLSDIMCTSLCGVDASGMTQNDTVCIWGLGPIGLCCAKWAQIRGAKRVLGIDMVKERLDLAREKLGIEVIDRTELDSSQLTQTVLELEPKGWDVCLECVGFRFPMSMMHKIERTIGLETDTPEIIDECLTCLKPYGSVFILGDYAGYANGFPVGKIMFKAARVSSRQANVQHYFPEAMKALQDGSFDPTFLVTHKIRLEEVPAFYEKLDNKESGVIKVFVDLRATSSV